MTGETNDCGDSAIAPPPHHGGYADFAQHRGELSGRSNSNSNSNATNAALKIGDSLRARGKTRPDITGVCTTQFGDSDAEDEQQPAKMTVRKTIIEEDSMPDQDAVINAPELSVLKKEYKWEIAWVNVILLGILHVGAVYGFYLKLTSVHHWSMGSFLIKLVTAGSTVGITGGAHRLWTHKAYKANYKLQCLLMFMATCTYQNSVYIWARDHRLHHKCSETDGDPHNAKRGFFFCHVGWLLVRKQPEVIEQGKSIDMSDLKANPIVMFQHKYYYPLVFLCTVVLPITMSRAYGVNWAETIFTCVMYRYVISVNLTWCINSVAHLYGQKPYDKTIGPTESQLMRIIGFGEGFHNYHHTFPWDYKAAEFGHDVRNITSMFIDFFAWLGWAYDRRVATDTLIEKRIERTGGTGRELHMKANDPDKLMHNICNLIVVAFYILIL